ncbi:hypothetical protein HID58_091377, partial [Brassica napus]
VGLSLVRNCVEPLGKSKNLRDFIKSHCRSASIGRAHRRQITIYPRHEEARRTTNDDSVLEERDPQYDTMLNQMVGRIKAKPGSKAEMGENSVSFFSVMSQDKNLRREKGLRNLKLEPLESRARGKRIPHQLQRNLRLSVLMKPELGGDWIHSLFAVFQKREY